MSPPKLFCANPLPVSTAATKPRSIPTLNREYPRATSTGLLFCGLDAAELLHSVHPGSPAFQRGDYSHPNAAIIISRLELIDADVNRCGAVVVAVHNPRFTIQIRRHPTRHPINHLNGGYVPVNIPHRTLNRFLCVKIPDPVATRPYRHPFSRLALQGGQPKIPPQSPR